MEFVLGVIEDRKMDMEVDWVGFTLEMNAMQQVQYQTMLTKYNNMRDKLLPKSSTLLTSGMPATVSHSEYKRSNWPMIHQRQDRITPPSHPQVSPWNRMSF